MKIKIIEKTIKHDNTILQIDDNFLFFLDFIFSILTNQAYQSCFTSVVRTFTTMINIANTIEEFKFDIQDSCFEVLHLKLSYYNQDNILLFISHILNHINSLDDVKELFRNLLICSKSCFPIDYLFDKAKNNDDKITSLFDIFPLYAK